jgi:alkylation response protein AidB-like acyl-CoA dehydrogenase
VVGSRASKTFRRLASGMVGTASAHLPIRARARFGSRLVCTSHSSLPMKSRVHFDQVRVPAANLIGQPGRAGKRIVTGAFSWTAALIGAACVGTMRAAFEYALGFARTEKRLGTVPVIEYQNVGFMLADIKMRIEACRYLTWKACHDFERTGGRAEELAIMTKV